jgi:Response regulator containing a CheY-like receiver domain and an HD-GYP domain
MMPPSASGCLDGLNVHIGSCERLQTAEKHWTSAEEKPDVILLDLMMPEMDGFEVVAALQGTKIGETFQSS